MGSTSPQTWVRVGVSGFYVGSTGSYVGGMRVMCGFYWRLTWVLLGGMSGFYLRVLVGSTLVFRWVLQGVSYTNSDPKTNCKHVNTCLNSRCVRFRSV